MNWFGGSIAEAVAQSKAKNAIFVVYVEGKDENTEKLSKFLNEPLIREKLETDNFIAIKIQSDSEAYLQFASIYQIVPIPSIFFIGKSGTPLEIATGIMSTVEELNVKIVKVLEMAEKSLASTSQITIQNSDCKNNTDNENGDIKNIEQDKMKEIQNINVQKSGVLEKQEAIICVDDVCYKKSVTTVATATTTESKGKDLQSDKENNANDNAAIPTTSKSMQIPKVASATIEGDAVEQKKLEETRKYLEQKRRERVEEEQRLEKERELKRRQEGKVVQNLRQWQHEQELKELQENLKREKMEEQAARDRIRAQIAADKAERAQKFAQARTTATTTAPPSNASMISSNNPVIGGGEAASTSAAAAAATAAEMRTISTDETRLQFRFASGLSRNHVFKCTTTLAEIRDYVIKELLPGTGIKDFILATTYPKREFTDEHNAMNLVELGLTPSAVILIISQGNSGPASAIVRSGSLFNMLSSVIWTVLNPIIAVLVTARNWVQRRVNGSGAGYSGRRNITGGQKRANEEKVKQNDSVKRRNLDHFMNAPEPSTSTKNISNRNNNNNADKNDTVYRRYMGNSNIHRLSDNHKDSDDENATWNGNSTQQQ